MSFSSEIKDEICHIGAADDCCARAELASVFLMNRANGAPGDRLITENAAFARRAYGLLRKLYGAPPDIIVSKNRRLKKNATYVVKIDKEMDLARQPGDAPTLKKLTKKRCCKKAALRGAFLAAGSITDPEKLYHLEIYCKDGALAEFFSGLMAPFGLGPKITERAEYFVLYVKDSGKIVDFLNVIGAHQALLSLENTRILKGMRNDVNRAVNCETANLEKTVNASLRHISNIIYIRDTIGFRSLPENLREIAAARLDHREISLKELGDMLSPPLGKSGVNHRLRKLDLIAENARGNHPPI